MGWKARTLSTIVEFPWTVVSSRPLRLRDGRKTVSHKPELHACTVAVTFFLVDGSVPVYNRVQILERKTSMGSFDDGGFVGRKGPNQVTTGIRVANDVRLVCYEKTVITCIIFRKVTQPLSLIVMLTPCRRA